MASRNGTGRLRRMRAWLGIAFVAIVAVFVLAPLGGQLAGWPATDPATENRALAPPPGTQVDVSSLERWPTAVDAWLNDHFGFRKTMIRSYNWILYRIFGEFASPRLSLGPHGRVLLNSHSAAEPFALIQHSRGFQVSDTMLRTAADGIADLLRRMDSSGTPSDVLIVPTAATVYPDDLPGWLARQCASARPPALAIPSLLPPAYRARFHFPVAVMKDPSLPFPAIPRVNFHWDGTGPDRVEMWLAEQVLGLSGHIDLPTTVVDKPSDVSNFFPGVTLTSPVAEADVQAAGVEACLGPACFPGFGPEAAILADLRRYKVPAFSGPPERARLLLIADSFGAMSAVWFARHFGEVWQVSTNNLEQLTPEQRAHAWRALTRDYRPGRIIFLYHDEAVLYFAVRLAELGLPE